ncbi:MAG: hypothetical protein WBG46_07155 [Nonlabens sp.]
MNSLLPSLLTAPHYVHQTYMAKFYDDTATLTIIPGGTSHVIAIYGDKITLDGAPHKDVVLLPQASEAIEINSTGKSVLLIAQCLALANYYIKDMGTTSPSGITNINHNLNLDYRQLDKEKHFNRFLRLITVPEQPPLLDSVLRYIYQASGCVSTRDIIARYATTSKVLQREFQEYINDSPTAYGKKVCFHACAAELCLKDKDEPDLTINKYYANKSSFEKAETKYLGEHNKVASLSLLSKKMLRLDYRLTDYCDV